MAWSVHVTSPKQSSREVTRCKHWLNASLLMNSSRNQTGDYSKRKSVPRPQPLSSEYEGKGARRCACCLTLSNQKQRRHCQQFTPHTEPYNEI